MISPPHGFDFIENAIDTAPTLTSAERDALDAGGWTTVFERGASFYEMQALEAADAILLADARGDDLDRGALLALAERGVASERLREAAKLGSDSRFECLPLDVRRYARAFCARGYVRVCAL